MKVLSSLLLLAATCLANPLLRRAPVLPSNDPFYTQPADIGSYQPGQVIAMRDVPPTLGGFTGLTKQPIKRFVQLLYRTTDALNNPVAAVASVLIPNNANNTQLLAYQTAYDSANNNCAPSYSLQTGANNTAIADVAMISAALNRGFYVVTADYETFVGSFTVGLTSGYATLDATRAALNSASKLGLSPQARYGMWGYSGGALAIEWASELQPSYAPELKFVGYAIGGIITNVTSTLQSINKGLFAGLAFSGISGFNKSLPEAHALYEDQVLPSKRADFEAIAAGCLAQAITGGAGKDLYSYFRNGSAALADPRFSAVVDYAGVAGTHGTPTAPVFAYKAVGDEISPANETDALIKKLCSQGAIIEYHRDVIGEHFTELIVGSVSAFAWISDRLDGKPVTNKQCVTQQVAISSIGPGSPAAFTIEIISLLQSLLGSPLPLGPIIGKKKN